jgi:hypothetical protein
VEASPTRAPDELQQRRTALRWLLLRTSLAHTALSSEPIPPRQLGSSE